MALKQSLCVGYRTQIIRNSSSFLNQMNIIRSVAIHREVHLLVQDSRWTCNTYTEAEHNLYCRGSFCISVHFVESHLEKFCYYEFFLSLLAVDIKIFIGTNFSQSKNLCKCCSRTIHFSQGKASEKNNWFKTKVLNWGTHSVGGWGSRILNFWSPRGGWMGSATLVWNYNPLN